MKRKLLLGCGLLAPPVYVGAVVIGGLLRPGYSHMAHAASELIAANAPNTALLVALFTLYDILLAVFGAGLLLAVHACSATRGRRSGSWGALTLVVTGVLLTFGYTLLFIAYALARTSVMILGRVEPGVAVGPLLANAVTIALAALTWACLLALLTAPIGLLTALALRRLLIWLNPPTRRRAAALGGLLAAVAVVTLYVVLQPRAGQYLSPAYPASLLFWFGLPSLTYICAAAWGGVQLQIVGETPAGGKRQSGEEVIAH